MAEKNNTYYWYYHRCPKNNDIVYIGIGTKDRAWYCRNRQPDHQQWLDILLIEGHTMDDIVEIGDTMLSREEALEIELSLIDEYRPTFNRNYRPNTSCILSRETFQIARELRGEGKTYNKIAEELGTSVMTIHGALSGGTKKYANY